MLYNETITTKGIIMSFDREPLFVVVTPTKWGAYGTTFRQRWLTQLLKAQGGIHDTVPPGEYHFNIERRGLRLYLTLEPATKL